MIYYENLAVYKKAFMVNKDIYQFLKNNNYSALPKKTTRPCEFQRDVEYRRGHSQEECEELKEFLYHGPGSAFKSVSLIRFLVSEEENINEMRERIYGFFEEISKMLFVMIGNLGKKA